MPKARIVQLMEREMIACGLPKPVLEHRFAPPRRFRFDFAWPDHKIGVEYEGGQWGGTKTNEGHIGGHRSPKGYAANCEKYNLATVQGWRVLRYTESMVRQVNWAAQIQELIDG